HLNPNVGRIEQLTTTGMLYWRTCDNLTVFTDSAVVWFSTPTGIQSRLAVEPSFPWEPSSECLGQSLPSYSVDVVTSTSAPTQTIELPVNVPSPAILVPTKPTAEACPDKIVSARNVDL